ncbi:MAG: HEAT repeat domain-containing protein [Deltaproteobacteria bacterium]|nr:HEAT repeat domain-containing protein [Deltaproteobacteria bacterium]MBW2128413.1 HEAT repeat domain-containing protein [Deltaproteobacteria bacterium]
MEGRFQGREILDRPKCPFCGIPLERPKELPARMPNEMPVGSCSCGAVYAFDVTGHNLGTAMIEALVFGCNGDWDLAWGLLPEEDYREKIIEHYDIESHLIVHGGAYQGRRILGTLYFIKIHEDVLEVTRDGLKKNLERSTPAVKEYPAGKTRARPLGKREVEDLVKNYRFEPLLKAAATDRRLLRHLQRLLYTVDTLLRYRAADALGQVSARIAETNPGAVSRLLQGFLTSLSDTAASSWGALDAIGEIIRNSPERFAGFVPQLFSFLKDRTLLPQVLRALEMIATASPAILRGKAFYFIPLLQDPEPAVRGYAALFLGGLGAAEAREELTSLLEDPVPLEIYRNGRIMKKTVGQLASESLEKL